MGRYQQRFIIVRWNIVKKALKNLSIYLSIYLYRSIYKLYIYIYIYIYMYICIYIYRDREREREKERVIRVKKTLY